MTKHSKLSNILPDSLPDTPEKGKGGHAKIEGVIGEQVVLVDDIMTDNTAGIISDETMIGEKISGCEIIELHEEETLPNGKKVRKATVRKKKGVTLYRYITEDNKIYEVEGEEIVTIFNNKNNKKLLLNGEKIELKKCFINSGDRCITKDDLFFRIEGCIVRRLRYDDKGNITHINVLENDKDKIYELKNGKMKRTKIENIKKFFKKFRKIK